VIESPAEDFAGRVLRYYAAADPDAIFLDEQPTLSERYTPHYGELLARRLVALMKRNGWRRILEVGGGRGTLAEDVLTWIERHESAFARTLDYRIVDFSLALCRRQEARIGGDRVINANALRLPLATRSFRGIVLSNEMLGDLPFKRASPTTDGEDGWNRHGIEAFLGESARIIDEGCLVAIEYGRPSRSVLNRLGAPGRDHDELGVHFEHLTRTADALFAETRLMTLAEWFQIAPPRRLLDRLVWEMIPPSIWLGLRKRWLRANAHRRSAPAAANSHIAKRLSRRYFDLLLSLPPSNRRDAFLCLTATTRGAILE
jgi:phospholipid N-methyltransferase